MKASFYIFCLATLLATASAHAFTCVNAERNPITALKSLTVDEASQQMAIRTTSKTYQVPVFRKNQWVFAFENPRSSASSLQLFADRSEDGQLAAFDFIPLRLYGLVRCY